MAKKKKTEEKKISFEASFDELQNIVDGLEDGNMTLDDSLKSYELGIKRLQECYQALNQAELKIRQLAKIDENGNLVTNQFEVSGNEEPGTPRYGCKWRPGEPGRSAFFEATSLKSLAFASPSSITALSPSTGFRLTCSNRIVIIEDRTRWFVWLYPYA